LNSVLPQESYCGRTEFLRLPWSARVRVGARTARQAPYWCDTTP